MIAWHATRAHRDGFIERALEEVLRALKAEGCSVGVEIVKLWGARARSAQLGDRHHRSNGTA
jgi:hypothetical protein